MHPAVEAYAGRVFDRFRTGGYYECKGRFITSHRHSVAPRPQFSPSTLSSDDLRKIVAEHLPAWLKACAEDTEIIAMHEEAFGTSGGELFLFACAIKYATQKGKIVHVTCGGDAQVPPELAFGIEATYRERKRRSK